MRGRYGSAKMTQHLNNSDSPQRNEKCLHYYLSTGINFELTALRAQGLMSVGNFLGSLDTPASGPPALDQLALPGSPSSAG